MHDDNPNTASMTPDRDVEIDRIRAGTRDAYTGAWRVARDTLTATGIDRNEGFGGMDPDRADRLVSFVLGAALLELEAPWRHALEETRSELRSHVRSLALIEEELVEVRRRLESTEAAFAHVQRLEGEHRDRADTLEAERNRARNLAVRLEGELAEITHVAGVVLDQAGGADDEDGERIPVRREALNRLADHLRTAEDLRGRIPATDSEESDR